LTNASPAEKKMPQYGTAIVAGLVAGVLAGIIAYVFAGLAGFIIAFIVGAITGSRATLLVRRMREQPS
jgi:fructose-specific phosphotransferase system IIC component